MNIYRLIFKPALNSYVLATKISYRSFNANTAAITKIHRCLYERTYPTLLVQPDGSTVFIRYFEPRKIIRLPLNLATLTDEERKARIEKRRPKTKVKIEEDIDDGFDANRYINLIKKGDKFNYIDCFAFVYLKG